MKNIMENSKKEMLLMLIIYGSLSDLMIETSGEGVCDYGQQSRNHCGKKWSGLGHQKTNIIH